MFYPFYIYLIASQAGTAVAPPITPDNGPGVVLGRDPLASVWNSAAGNLPSGHRSHVIECAYSSVSPLQVSRRR
jgi:hypothetical protein